MARPGAHSWRGLTRPEASDTLEVSQPESKPELALVNLAFRVCGSILSRTARKCANYHCIQGRERSERFGPKRFSAPLCRQHEPLMPVFHRPLAVFQDFSERPGLAPGRLAFAFEFLR